MKTRSLLASVLIQLPNEMIIFNVNSQIFIRYFITWAVQISKNYLIKRQCKYSFDIL